jgi:hypothetical protein
MLRKPAGQFFNWKPRSLQIAHAYCRPALTAQNNGSPFVPGTIAWFSVAYFHPSKLHGQSCASNTSIANQGFHLHHRSVEALKAAATIPIPSQYWNYGLGGRNWVLLSHKSAPTAPHSSTCSQHPGMEQRRSSLDTLAVIGMYMHILLFAPYFTRASIA